MKKFNKGFAIFILGVMSALLVIQPQKTEANAITFLIMTWCLMASILFDKYNK